MDDIERLQLLVDSSSFEINGTMAAVKASAIPTQLIFNGDKNSWKAHKLFLLNGADKIHYTSMVVVSRGDRRWQPGHGVQDQKIEIQDTKGLVLLNDPQKCRLEIGPPQPADLPADATVEQATLYDSRYKDFERKRKAIATRNTSLLEAETKLKEMIEQSLAVSERQRLTDWFDAGGTDGDTSVGAMWAYMNDVLYQSEDTALVDAGEFEAMYRPMASEERRVARYHELVEQRWKCFNSCEGALYNQQKKEQFAKWFYHTVSLGISTKVKGSVVVSQLIHNRYVGAWKRLMQDHTVRTAGQYVRKIEILLAGLELHDLAAVGSTVHQPLMDSQSQREGKLNRKDLRAMGLTAQESQKVLELRNAAAPRKRAAKSKRANQVCKCKSTKECTCTFEEDSSDENEDTVSHRQRQQRAGKSRNTTRQQSGGAAPGRQRTAAGRPGKNGGKPPSRRAAFVEDDDEGARAIANAPTGSDTDDFSPRKRQRAGQGRNGKAIKQKALTVRDPTRGVSVPIRALNYGTRPRLAGPMDSGSDCNAVPSRLAHFLTELRKTKPGITAVSALGGEARISAKGHISPHTTDVYVVEGLEEPLYSVKELRKANNWVIFPPVCKEYPHGVYVVRHKDKKIVMVGDDDLIVDPEAPVPEEAFAGQLPLLPVSAMEHLL